MHRIKASTCHEIGLQWEIDYPAELDQEEIREILRAILDESDIPDMEALRSVLSNLEECSDDYPDLNSEHLHLYKRIEFITERVHSDAFVNTFEADNI